MQRIFRHRPSPATVIATIALLVALGGTSAAAVRALEPPNSVGTAQVIDNSLLSKDFKAGQLKAGPAGPSNAYAVAADGPVTVPTTPATVATLQIPKAGNYVLWAKAVVEDTGSGDEAVSCQLLAGDATDTNRAYLPRAASTGTISNLLVNHFSGAGNAQLACNSAAGNANARHIELVAIKVATLASS